VIVLTASPEEKFALELVALSRLLLINGRPSCPKAGCGPLLVANNHFISFLLSQDTEYDIRLACALDVGILCEWISIRHGRMDMRLVTRFLHNQPWALVCLA
jgi:hypothetical protein